MHNVFHIKLMFSGECHLSECCSIECYSGECHLSECCSIECYSGECHLSERCGTTQL
jgi:hypothetical protein